MPREALRQSRTWINLFLVYVGLVTLANGLIVARISRNWVISNWLINYQGGFIRRGLPGEIAFQLRRFTHVSPVFYVVCFYLILCAVLLLAFWSLALRSSRNVWVLALLVSPATLSFQVLHPKSGFSKDLIHLGIFALFVVLLDQKKLSAISASVFLTIYIVGSVLSHEALIFYAPYFFAALIIGGRSLFQAAKECAIPALAGLLVTYLCSTHIGNVNTAVEICSSLGYKFIVPGSSEICASGAIPYLIRTREFAHAETLMDIRRYQYFAVFPAFALLALLPAIGESFVLVRSRLSRETAVIWLSAFVSFLGTLVLFYYAYDWGRWIYMHVTSLAILLLFLDNRRVSEPRQETTLLADVPGRQRYAYAMFLIAYATLWILPNAIEPIRLGYVGRVFYLVHHDPNGRAETRQPVE